MGGSYQQDFKEMVDNVAVAGTAEEVIRKLQAFVGAGARHFIFMPAPGPEGDRSAIVQRLVEEVIPSVREHAAERA
jgi:alkanesulfonate monooxygenase SsuD/methylene tetrahydromethanopterin reductase-like flavin-dependent oxidoreductase (luciferase family)